MRKTLILALAFSLAISLLIAQGAISVPPPEAVGGFEGTWFYVDTDFRIAVFIATDKSGMVRMRYHVRTKGEIDYETDEGGFAKYLDNGVLVEVLFTGGATDSNRIEGYHERTVHPLEGGAITESGDFVMYRTEKGGKLVLHYPEWKTVVTDPSGKETISADKDRYRFFRKASDIVVSFDEILF